MPRTERLQPDPEIVRRLGAIALALPEAYEEDAWTGVRWRIRGRTFAHVVVAQEGYESSYFEITGLPGPETVLTFPRSAVRLAATRRCTSADASAAWSGATTWRRGRTRRS